MSIEKPNFRLSRAVAISLFLHSFIFTSSYILNTNLNTKNNENKIQNKYNNILPINAFLITKKPIEENMAQEAINQTDPKPNQPTKADKPVKSDQNTPNFLEKNIDQKNDNLAKNQNLNHKTQSDKLQIPNDINNQSANKKLNSKSKLNDKDLYRKLYTQFSKTYFYPEISIKNNESGSIILILYFDSIGKVIDTSIIKSSGFKNLDNAAIISAQSMQLIPELANKSINFEANFTLED